MADIDLVIRISEEDFEIMKHNIAVNNPLCPLSQEEMVAKVANGVPILDKMAIKALEQESIDYKTRYENFRKKSGVVISQLRADHDRLQEAIDKIRAEIESESAKSFKYPEWERAIALEWVLNIIDKYMAESEGE